MSSNSAHIEIIFHATWPNTAYTADLVYSDGKRIQIVGNMSAMSKDVKVLRSYCRKNFPNYKIKLKTPREKF